VDVRVVVAAAELRPRLPGDLDDLRVIEEVERQVDGRRCR